MGGVPVYEFGGGVDTNFQSIAESEPLNNLITSESGFRGLCTDARGDPEDIQCGLRNAGGSAPWPDDVRGGPVRGAAPGGGVGVVCERRGSGEPPVGAALRGAAGVARGGAARRAPRESPSSEASLVPVTTHLAGRINPSLGAAAFPFRLMVLAVARLPLALREGRRGDRLTLLPDGLPAGPCVCHPGYRVVP